MEFLAAPDRQASSEQARAAVSLMAQWLLQATARRILLVVTPERLYSRRLSLPADLLRTYFDEQVNLTRAQNHLVPRIPPSDSFDTVDVRRSTLASNDC